MTYLKNKDAHTHTQTHMHISNSQIMSRDRMHAIAHVIVRDELRVTNLLGGL